MLGVVCSEPKHQRTLRGQTRAGEKRAMNRAGKENRFAQVFAEEREKGSFCRFAISSLGLLFLRRSRVCSFFSLGGKGEGACAVCANVVCCECSFCSPECIRWRLVACGALVWWPCSVGLFGCALGFARSRPGSSKDRLVGASYGRRIPSPPLPDSFGLGLDRYV